MNSFLDFGFVTRVDLGTSGQISIPSVAVGDKDLDAESLTAIEMGYIGGLERPRSARPSI